MIKLNHIADIHIGYNLRSVVKTERQTVSIISAKGLAEDFQNADETTIPSSFSNYLQDGDILVKSRGDRYEAKVFRAQSKGRLYIASNTLIVVRLTTGNYRPAYIAQVINSEKAQQFLRLLSSGQVVPTLSPSSLGHLSCPEISLRKQEQLENTTRTLDDYRIYLAQYQKAGEKLAKAIEQQLMKGVE